MRRFVISKHSKAAFAAAALAFCAMGAATTLPASAQPATPGTQGPGLQVVPPNRVSMDFRIVEGSGPFGLTRWIQASGPFLPETPARFAEFARANRVNGMTVALDSGGGAMGAGLAIGRAFRAAGINTIVGRTVVRTENGRQIATMITHNVGCASACTYAFIGGVQRTVPRDARFGVHQFSRNIGRDGRYVTEAPTQQDISQIQSRMASLAVYVQEMGVDARLLELAASMPYGGQLRFLSPVELGDLRVATSVTVNEAERGTIGWSSHARADMPMLFRRSVRTLDDGQRVDEEVALTCHREAGQAMLHYRAIVVRAAEGFSLRVPAIRVDVAGQQVNWTAPRPAEARGTNSWVGIGVAVPRASLEEAGRRGALAVELPQGASPQGRSEIGDGLGAQLFGFLAACDAVRANMAAVRQ